MNTMYFSSAYRDRDKRLELLERGMFEKPDLEQPVDLSLNLKFPNCYFMQFLNS